MPSLLKQRLIPWAILILLKIKLDEHNGLEHWQSAISNFNDFWEEDIFDSTGNSTNANAKYLREPSLFHQRPKSLRLQAREAKPDPHQHAIVIPYRDRPFHLKEFIKYMDPYLKKHFPNARFSCLLWNKTTKNCSTEPGWPMLA